MSLLADLVSCHFHERGVHDIARLAGRPGGILMMWPAIRSRLSATMSYSVPAQSCDYLVASEAQLTCCSSRLLLGYASFAFTESTKAVVVASETDGTSTYDRAHRIHCHFHRRPGLESVVGGATSLFLVSPPFLPSFSLSLVSPAFLLLCPSRPHISFVPPLPSW